MKLLIPDRPLNSDQLETIRELDRLFQQLRGLKEGVAKDNLSKALQSTRNLIAMGFTPYIVKRRAGNVVGAANKLYGLIPSAPEEEENAEPTTDTVEVRALEEGGYGPGGQGLLPVDDRSGSASERPREQDQAGDSVEGSNTAEETPSQSPEIDGYDTLPAEPDQEGS